MAKDSIDTVTKEARLHTTLLMGRRHTGGFAEPRRKSHFLHPEKVHFPLRFVRKRYPQDGVVFKLLPSAAHCILRERKRDTPIVANLVVQR